MCLRAQLPARLDGEEDDEDEPPGPMTTRLRRQAEREREQEHEREQRRRRRGRESFESDGLPAAQPNPSQWTVEQVCSYINSIPGSDVKEKKADRRQCLIYFFVTLIRAT